MRIHLITGKNGVNIKGYFECCSIPVEDSSRIIESFYMPELVHPHPKDLAEHIHEIIQEAVKHDRDITIATYSDIVFTCIRYEILKNHLEAGSQIDILLEDNKIKGYSPIDEGIFNTLKDEIEDIFCVNEKELFKLIKLRVTIKNSAEETTETSAENESNE